MFESGCDMTAPWSTSLLVLACGILPWSGCTSVARTSRIPFEEIARYSPSAEVVSPVVALDLAHRYVQNHPGADFAIGSGDSMLPLYHDQAVIILERPSLSELKVGQTVIFVGADCVPVAHIIVQHSPEGWITMGLNNLECDPGVLSEASYVGVVVKAYQPTASAVLAFAGTREANNFAAVQ
jgi:hypothetical protein